QLNSFFIPEQITVNEQGSAQLLPLRSSPRFCQNVEPVHPSHDEHEREASRRKGKEIAVYQERRRANNNVAGRNRTGTLVIDATDNMDHYQHYSTDDSSTDDGEHYE
ncbi:hypothetical protein MKW94_028123, partial [Papaver nudicaule]|nr:hypothetical protein [Papaver nudicaule]